LGFHNIAYTEWGSRTARPPVICVHGLTRNGRDFHHLASALEQETQIFCPDIVGRGKSDFLKDPTLYTYGQYITDMTALLARMDTASVDWVGTSMGGIIGMYMAAMDNAPIRRLVLNDVGPYIPLAALKRISDYAGMELEFADMDQLERHLRANYASFGITRDEDWKHFTKHSARRLASGKWAAAYDPGIAQNLKTLTKDVDFWDMYDRIRCPTLLLRGEKSDVLLNEVAQQMTLRGPKASCVEFSDVGHAPALVEASQLTVIQEFLRQ
jgi:pimeloyl-ACP methyl ester carboxylesterase